jgi:hypothetical protein
VKAVAFRYCAALLFFTLAGCSAKTGMLVEVQGPAGQSSIAAGVATLELVAAHRSWCERWVEDKDASHTRVDVHARDLQKKPYTFLIEPNHFTDLSEAVAVIVLARDASDRVIGAADFGDHPYRLRHLDEYTARIALLQRPEASYAASDGCVCLPGAPWMGNGSGAGCDLDVVTSFDRLIDTAGCELPPGARELTSPVCDGQQYDGETVDRELPCFAAHAGACQLTTRTCHDQDGVAWGEECLPDQAAPSLPTGALCDAYLACEQQACGDLTACFLQKVPAARTLSCVLHVDPTTAAGAPIAPCASGGKWQAVLDNTATAAGCVASAIEGVKQGAFSLGFLDTGATDPQATASDCPVTFAVGAIDANSPAEVPDGHDLDVTIGDQVVHIHIHVERACDNGPSLVCT